MTVLIPCSPPVFSLCLHPMISSGSELFTKLKFILQQWGINCLRLPTCLYCQARAVIWCFLFWTLFGLKPLFAASWEIRDWMKKTGLMGTRNQRIRQALASVTSSNCCLPPPILELRLFFYPLSRTKRHLHVLLKCLLKLHPGWGSRVRPASFGQAARG